MKVLITGANGLLGHYLVKILLDKNYSVIATGKGKKRISFDETEQLRYYDMDILLEYRVHEIFEKEKPDVVIHAAAMTQVDECEMNPSRCEETNVRGTSHVLINAEECSAHLIYLSTDFVFDGEKGMYREDDEPNPVNFYGFTKMQAESLVQGSEIPWTIVRTCLVYGTASEGMRSNILTWIKESLENRKAIKVVDDQMRTPTYAEDLAVGIERIISKKAAGIFHISGEERMTPYNMACTVAGHFGYDNNLIEKVTAATFSQPGKRPPKTGFIINKAKKELGFRPTAFKEALFKIFASKTEL